MVSRSDEEEPENPPSPDQQQEDPEDTILDPHAAKWREKALHDAMQKLRERTDNLEEQVKQIAETQDLQTHPVVQRLIARADELERQLERMRDVCPENRLEARLQALERGRG